MFRNLSGLNIDPGSIETPPMLGLLFSPLSHGPRSREGPLAGLVADEPEYEDFAMFGSQIDQKDPMGQ